MIINAVRHLCVPEDERERTKQCFKDQCDINKIVQRYKKTGRLPDLITGNPSYGDFSTALDYHAACNMVLKAETQFNALPAKVRSRFGNDPAKMLEFVADPNNAKEMIELGMAKEKVENEGESVVEKDAEASKAGGESGGEK